MNLMLISCCIALMIFFHFRNNVVFIMKFSAPSSPSGHQRKLLYANRGLRTGSVDLPDEMEKSLSSASTSPCPSPVRQYQVVIHNEIGLNFLLFFLFQNCLNYLPFLLGEIEESKRR